MMLHKRPTVIVHTMVFIDEELAQVSRRHVGWDLHHLSEPILAEDFYDLKCTTKKQTLNYSKQACKTLENLNCVTILLSGAGRE